MRSRWFDRLEWGFAVLTVVALLANLIFFVENGYLHEPFFHDADDSFMDWYNSAYWAHKVGAYEEWGTVYPPMSFVFLKVFSNGACYSVAGPISRSCDGIGVAILSLLLPINFVLTHRTFRRLHPSTALPRAFAVSLGLPMLYAFERGNLILPCFTAFVLGYSSVVRSAWVRWLCIAVTINFKPYLAIAMAPGVLNRRWRWLEGCGLMVIAVYLLSYTIIGEGTPFELVDDILKFSVPSEIVRLEEIGFKTTYSSLLNVLHSSLPLTPMVGSEIVERVQTLLPILMRLGELGVLVCFAGAFARPGRLSRDRLGGLALCLLLTITDPGGYTIVFLLFLLFKESSPSPLVGTAILLGFLSCVPWDFPVTTIAHQTGESYFSGRRIEQDLSVTVGELARPAVVLLIEYLLIAASLPALLRPSRSNAKDAAVVAPPAIA